MAKLAKYSGLLSLNLYSCSLRQFSVRGKCNVFYKMRHEYLGFRIAYCEKAQDCSQATIFEATMGKKADYKSIITIEPGKRSGQPCIRGMRITVYDILSYLAAGMTEQEILHDFPELTREDIRASLAFAAEREKRIRRTA